MRPVDLRVGPPSPDVLADALNRAQRAHVTYAEVGRTLSPTAPGVTRRVAWLGDSPEAFVRGVDGIRRWVCHAGIGASLHPDSPELAESTTMVVSLPVGPFTVLAPTRIVAVVDEPDRFGFAYGTLPGHPERGEESFIVSRSSTGGVRLEIAVAASTIPLLRPLAPVILVAQRRALRGYLRSMQRYVL